MFSDIYMTLYRGDMFTAGNNFLDFLRTFDFSEVDSFPALQAIGGVATRECMLRSQTDFTAATVFPAAFRAWVVAMAVAAHTVLFALHQRVEDIRVTFQNAGVAAG
jgi:hypothetical protein